MKPIKNILLAIDGEYQKQALANEVSAVARGGAARVTLLNVFDAPSGDKKMNEESTSLQQWMEEDRLGSMKDISSALVEKGIEVMLKQSHGKPYLEIVHEALAGGYDLVMKPAESKTSLKDVLFGSADMQIFRMSPYPTWIFKPTPSMKLNIIMVAVDLLKHDKEKNALADKVLQWGKAVANLVGAELHVIHTWSLFGELTMRGRAVTAVTVDKLVEDEKRGQLQLLNDALARNGLERNQIKVHFIKGEAEDLIPELARSVQADLLVMGTVGRTGIPGFFIGNTADSILRQVNCSVLAIKPDGFVTPVKSAG